MGISPGHSEINAESSEIYYVCSQKLLQKRDAPPRRHRTGINTLPNQACQRSQLPVYQHPEIWSFLCKDERNRKDFWRLCQKIGYALFRAAIRGGNWNTTSDAGVFALNLNNDPSNRNNNIGFRAALILTKAGVIDFTEFIREHVIPRTHILVSSIVELAKNMNRWVVISRDNRTLQSIALRFI